ncbi:SUKH-3 domain-containing protein [Kitasatospora sp. NBC_01250]|uniref:SUKH-3 domain-containing protein n=1 Tax=unclassified Kitasatospora TaxID=2633591 RepID=UPI002E11833D|nr:MULTISPECIES: SUKH-3 domain-containing protein [unclassified Kitasatospora]WSJ71991.1 SUKH-3 domain-containing protein [Kitasatospora sp. NBC_01302]
MNPLTSPAAGPASAAVRSQPRFPADVAAALKQAGWHPGRWEIRRAEEWADELLSRHSADGVQHAVFPAAIEAWAEFGGLSFDLGGAGRELARTPFLLDPICGLHLPRTLADLSRALDSRVAPLGEEHYGQALLAIDEAGRVYSLDHTGEWFLGADLDQAVTALVLGTRPERLRTVTDPL